VFEASTSLAGILMIGVTLGLASALHCATMCGCIASSLLLAFDPMGTRSRISVLLEMQAGRVATYTALGGAVGLIGSAGYDLVPPAEHFRIMQTAGAVSIVAVGLWTAGLLPVPVSIGRAARWTVTRLDGIVLSRYRGRSVAPFAAGVAWGANPCPMVLAALFSAAITGTWYGGAMMMLGFGLGTLPAVMASGYGVARLAAVRANARTTLAAGLLVATAGAISAFGGWSTISDYCFSG